MRTDDEAGAAVDEMAEALLFAGRFRMEIEDDRIRLLAERTGVEDRLSRLEGIIEFRMHEDAAHDIGNQNAGAVAGKEQVGTAAGRAGRVVGRAKKLVVPLAEDHRFLLVPDVIARGHHVGTGVDRLEEDVFGDAEAASGIFAVDDDEIELEVTDQSRKPLPDRRAARLAHHISQKQKPHARSNPTRAVPAEARQRSWRPDLRKTKR